MQSIISDGLNTGYIPDGCSRHRYLVKSILREICTCGIGCSEYNCVGNIIVLTLSPRELICARDICQYEHTKKLGQKAKIPGLEIKRKVRK